MEIEELKKKDYMKKYICANRKDEIITGYSIRCFPIGIKEKEYLKDKLFSISKYGSKEKTLESAIQYLSKLKEEYKYIEEEVIIVKEKSIEKSITEKKENKILEKLPEYIYPILEDNKINGYYVDNIFNNKGKKYPRRDFKENTNRWNLDQAKKFVEMLKYINENNVELKYATIDDLEVNDIEKAFQQFKDLHTNNPNDKLLKKVIALYEAEIKKRAEKRERKTQKEKDRNSRIFKRSLRDKNTMNDFDFYDKVTDFFNQIVINICKFNESDVNTNAIKLECTKTIYVFVTENFINSIKDESMTLKYIEDNIEEPIIKDMFKKYYQPLIDKHYDEYFKDFTAEEIVMIKNKYC